MEGKVKIAYTRFGEAYCDGSDSDVGPEGGHGGRSFAYIRSCIWVMQRHDARGWLENDGMDG